MSSPGSNTRRRDLDICKLMQSKFDVTTCEENPAVVYVKFHGPPDTCYEGGVWGVRVHIPEKYPYVSPSIGFQNRIFHPNIEERSGSVCLDVISQTWTPMYDLFNVFHVFLPQLLTYPNAADPLNPEAATLYLQNTKNFQDRVKTHIAQHATEEAYQKLVGLYKRNTTDATTSTTSSSGADEEESDLSDLSDTEPEPAPEPQEG